MFGPINLYKPSHQMCFLWINNEIKQKVITMSIMMSDITFSPKLCSNGLRVSV